MTCCVATCWSAADKTGRDVQSEGGWTQHDDVPVSVPALQVETRSATSTQDEPRSYSCLRSRYVVVIVNYGDAVTKKCCRGTEQMSNIKCMHCEFTKSTKLHLASSLTRSLFYSQLKTWLFSKSFPSFPFLPDWFHGLSDRLMILLCATAGFVCMVC